MFNGIYLELRLHEINFFTPRQRKIAILVDLLDWVLEPQWLLLLRTDSEGYDWNWDDQLSKYASNTQLKELFRDFNTQQRISGIWKIVNTVRQTFPANWRKAHPQDWSQNLLYPMSRSGHYNLFLVESRSRQRHPRLLMSRKWSMLSVESKLPGLNILQPNFFDEYRCWASVQDTCCDS